MGEGATLAGGRSSDYGKFFIYMVCLGVSFGLFLAVRGPGSGTVFWALSGLAMLGIVMGALAPNALGILGGVIPQAAVGLAIALALMNALEHVTFIWPAALVLLFASRVLAELADLRLTLAWRAPLRAHPPAAAQSLGAALALGGFLALAFEQLLAFLLMTPDMRLALSDGGKSVGGIVIDALRGDTIVHRALVYLFFVVVAFIADAWRLYLRDRRMLMLFGQRLREEAEPGTSPVYSQDALAGALGLALAQNPGSWSLLACRNIVDAGRMDNRSDLPAFRAATEFHYASRRFMKGLIPLLPLLGFVGTVIGLSITLSQLPHDTSQAGRAALDISASLGGLAIKFQTTLLGLAGGMIASTAINLLEKAETELLAECALLVSAVSRAPVEVKRVGE